LSELDPVRRGFVLNQAGQAGQTLITTTDMHDFGTSILSRATTFRVERGTLTAFDAPSAPEQAAANHDQAADAPSAAPSPVTGDAPGAA
jgi:hypothetical protein